MTTEPARRRPRKDPPVLDASDDARVVPLDTLKQISQMARAALAAMLIDAEPEGEDDPGDAIYDMLTWLATVALHYRRQFGLTSLNARARAAVTVEANSTFAPEEPTHAEQAMEHLAEVMALLDHDADRQPALTPVAHLTAATGKLLHTIVHGHDRPHRVVDDGGDEVVVPGGREMMLDARETIRTVLATLDAIPL